MKVFLSWSGDLSRELAEALRDWLPAVLQSVRPFFTPNDIEKGARWSKDISQELESSCFGIFCLTKDNLAKPWIMFEAGALSKRVDSSRVCPVLFGIDSADLEGPLVQFQASAFSEAEMRKLVKTLNSGLGDQRLDDSVLNSVFDMWWPRLNEKVSKIMENNAGKKVAITAARSERDILEEILQLTRLNANSVPRSSRSHERIDPSAIIHTLKNILELCEQLSSDGQISLLPTVREIFMPLKYVLDKNSFTTRHEEEIDHISKQIDGHLSASA